MSAFEVSVTPTRIRNARKHAVGREPTAVCMAPFSAKSITTFEGVPVTKTAKRILEVINPTEQVLLVKVTKMLSAEVGVQMEWTETEIPAQGCVRLELVWSPNQTITHKGTIQFMDQRNLKKDVSVILKSVDKPKAANPASLQLVPKKRKSPVLAKPPSSTQSTRPPKQPKAKPIENKENTPPKNRSPANISAMLDEIVFTPSVRANPVKEQQLTFSALLGEIKFTPDRSNANRGIETTPTTRTKGPAPLWAMNTPKAPDAPVPEPAQSVPPNPPGDFAPGVCSTTVRDSISPTSAQEGDSCSRRKLFTEHQPNAFELPDNHPFDFKLTPPNRVTPTASPSDRNRVALFSASVSPQPPTISSTTSSPARSALTMIREEDSERSVTQITGNQQTFVIRSNNSADISPATTLTSDAYNSITGNTPLRKQFQSMRNLDQIVDKQQKMMRQNQGSMPNLNDIQLERPIESNRYFYQKDEMEHLTQNMHQVTRSLGSSVSSMMSTDRSAHDLHFMENEILAESSRFNINRCHETSQHRLDFTRSASSVHSVPTTDNRMGGSGTFAIPRPAQPRRGAASTMQVPTIMTISPTQPRKPGQAKRPLGPPSEPTPILRRSYKHSPPKRTKTSRDESSDSSFFRSTASSPGSSLRISKSTSSLVKGGSPSRNHARKLSGSSSAQALALKQRRDQRVTLFNAELHVSGVINPDPFAATTTVDPFMAATMYLDPHCVERHELDFIKWLNALVTIPSDLDVSSSKPIDFGALFQHVRSQDITLAPSKDVVSSNYFTKYRLDGLRRAAIKLYVSDEMRLPVERLIVNIERKALVMRSDRNLHRDITRQREILELLHCFNPMWLRLGLEVVFGEQIYMKNNHDVMSLSYFIVNRLFRDLDQEAKHNKAYTRSDEYDEYVKKYTLKKILILLVFLDKAKLKQIVAHNPCLFVKNAPFKEMPEVLLKFASVMIGQIGDIKKELRRIGIVLSHKQTYLDEFDYAFRNLAIDLRDGVRLTKVMEIIALRTDLTQRLRVPAISRLQRVHNVGLALQALSEAGYAIKGSIQASDIADGHREKTLSLLWQLIYSFRAPMFNEAANTIQRWWRRSWLRVCIDRRVRHKREQRRLSAAIVLQAAFRGRMARKAIRVYLEERVRATIMLQSYVRRYLAVKQFTQMRMAAVCIQRRFHETRGAHKERRAFIKLRSAAVCVQRFWRGHQQTQRLTADLVKLRTVVVRIQQIVRSKIAMRRDRLVYLQYRKSVVCVQQHFRGNVLMRDTRAEYLKLREKTIFIQRIFRAKLLMRIARNGYTHQRRAAIVMQRRFRAQISMRTQRAQFIQQRQAAVFCQRRYRAKKAAHNQQLMYQSLRKAVVCIQQKWRARRMMIEERRHFEELRLATVWCQQRFRATRAMRVCRTEFVRQRDACLMIQRKFMAQMQMICERMAYRMIRSRVIVIQLWWRANRLRIEHRSRYLALKSAVVLVQRRFRALVAMRQTRSDFVKLRASAVCVQRIFRANLIMRRHRTEYQAKRKAAVVVQTWFRSLLEMRRQREEFLRIRTLVVFCQRRFRCRQAMQKQRCMFEELRRATLCVQRRWRAQRCMRIQQLAFTRLKAVTVRMQRRHRANIAMMEQHSQFLCIRQSIVTIQGRYRATLLMRTVRSSYQMLRSKVIYIQRLFRANRLSRDQRQQFLQHRSATICIQRRFRAKLATRAQRASYLQLRTKTIFVQRLFRANVLRSETRASYDQLRVATNTIQMHFRQFLLARKHRAEYLSIRRSAIMVQVHLRSVRLMRSVRQEYTRLRECVILVQTRFRALRAMRLERGKFVALRRAAIVCQQQRRAMLAMRRVRNEFVSLRTAVCSVQERYRAKLMMRRESARFQQIKKTVRALQPFCRGWLGRQNYRAMLTPEVLLRQKQIRSVRLLQRVWRGHMVRRKSTRQLQAIRRNIRELVKTSEPQMIVRNRIAHAVGLLKGRYNVFEELRILRELVKISREVPQTLINDARFIATFCYSVMAQAIRSETDKEVIELCSCVILNLSRFVGTKRSAFQVDGLETVAQMLLRWCNKECAIFNTLCAVIYVQVQNDEMKKVIRNYLTGYEAKYILGEIKKLVIRKERMKNNRAPNPMFPKLTPRQRSQIPMLQADFGLRSNRKAYIFLCSVFAFDTIMEQLDIQVLANV